MREILFRGKQYGNGEWVEGSLLIDEAGNCYIGTYLKPDKCNSLVVGGGRQIGKTATRFLGIGFVLVDPETVGQFTGMTDMKGQKIFEGDIIEWDEIEWGGKYKEQVKWDYSLLSMRKNDWPEWCEVIGNIHDNPELLEGA